MKGWKQDENGENGDRSPGVGKKGEDGTQGCCIPDYSSGGPQIDINSTDKQAQRQTDQPGDR